MSTTPSEDQNEQLEQPGQLPEENALLVQLGSDLWVDLDAGVVIRKQQKIWLTVREFNVLRILIYNWRNARNYISARVIADRIHLSDIHNPEHSIEQTISLLRRKLGDTAYHPHILQGRRGFGYRLFAEIKPDSSQH